MAVAAGPSDLLRISDLGVAQLRHLIGLSERMKAEPLGWRTAHTGKVFACLFARPSTRTRVSLETAAYRLGMLPMMLHTDDLELGRDEPVYDTGPVLSRYVDAIAVRTFEQHEAEALAGAASIPVINALTDQHHPCQALADLLTLHERFGKLAGIKLAYVGDGNNVAHSLMEAGALASMDVAIATPVEHRPDPGVTSIAQELAALHGGSLALFSDPRDAVTGAHAVYTDIWGATSRGEKRDEQLKRLRPFRVTESLMAMARPGALFMHCLPAHRGEEVEPQVIDGPQSVVLEQAANRLPAEQALIHTLLSGDWGS
jgi:ornithine carbamoyltransferase